MPGSAEPPAAGRAAGGEVGTGEAPGSWRRRWGRVGGPLLTLGTITTLEFVSRTEFPISASAAVSLIAVAFVTHTFGLASGLVSGAVTVGYAAYFFSTPGLVFDYARDNLLRVLLLAVTTPATAVLVGLLRRRADSAARAAGQRAQEATASQAALEVRAARLRTLASLNRTDLLGGTGGVTVTLRDVTREREIDRMKTDFVSTVSHELRTPLTSIKGSLHLLLSDSSLAVDEVQRQLLDISLKNTDRLIRLINNILDVSKIEAGQIRLELGSHHVSDFVSAAVEGIAAFAESRAIAIDRVIPEDLPRVTVDFDRMVQVLTNLLSNAVKFSPAGSRVTVSAALAAGELEISVTDQGRGIGPQDVPRLFQKFRQLDGSSVREVGGTGLGLAICRGIVEEHGGRITVESQPGAGATFTARLPAAGTVAPPVAAPAEAAADGPLILVVDDEPDLREAIRAQLETAGFRVVEAGRALEAIEVARDRRPDLITMDLMMPDLDGLEAVRLLREHAETRETPVVMVTAIEMDASQFGPLGPTGSLTKPFSQRDLLATIRSHLPAGRGASPR